MTRLTLLCALLFAGAARADDALDVTRQGLVLAVPGTDAVTVRRDLSLPGAPRFDLYLPAATKGPLPVVIFANGVGDRPGSKLKDWAVYRDWARAVAARGHAAILHEAGGATTRADISGLLAAVASRGESLGLDGGRLAVWACSANVRDAFSILMDDAPRGVRAAVLYYGNGPAAKLRTDLPIFWVLAGQDGVGLIRGQRELWARALVEGAPWTMVNAPALPHAFDALDTSDTSRRVVRDTLDYLDAQLDPLPAAPPPSAARDILADMYGLRFDRALVKLEARVKQNPRDQDGWFSLARAYRGVNRAPDAVRAYQKVLELAPGDADATRNLAITAAGAGDCKTAGPHLLRLEKDAPGDRFVLTAVAACAGIEGRRDDARRALEKVVATGFDAGVAYYNQACALALAGKRDDALAALEEATRRGFKDGKGMAEDPDLTSLRGEARFKALLGRMGS